MCDEQEFVGDLRFESLMRFDVGDILSLQPGSSGRELLMMLGQHAHASFFCQCCRIC